MSTQVFARRPRLAPPEMPAGEMQVEAPPEVPRAAPPSPMTYILPGVMVLMCVGFVVMGKGHAASWSMSLMMLMSVVGMIGMNRGNNKKAQLNVDRHDYLAYLDSARKEITKVRDQQRAALLWSHPEPRALWTMAGSRRMWERRHQDDDFLAVRVAVGRQRLARTLRAPQTGPLSEVDPVGAVALRKFLVTHSLVDAMPISVRLQSFPVVEVSGEKPAARDLVRSMLCQLATFHGPDSLRIAACTDSGTREQWDWLKWLPHNQHPTLRDSLGSTRLMTGSLSALEGLLQTELEGRQRFSKNTSTDYAGAHVVIVVDGSPAMADGGLLASNGLNGVTIIDLSGGLSALSVRRGLRLLIEDDQVGARSRAGIEWLGPRDHVSRDEADGLARQLSPYRVAEAATAEDSTTFVATELVDMLGIGDPQHATAAQLWRPRSRDEMLRVPFGVGVNGESVELDLKEAAFRGMGPHGLVIGATGSGKSEFLRTLVLALAVTHPPEDLNFILVDFKGGATFAPFGDLTHTAAVITNLADDLSMVDRMYDAVDGELARRQEVLHAAGAANKAEYDRARAGGADLPPLPSLVVICDEFSELLSQRPDFIELFVSITRIGRSLGVHLLLASQRLDEGRLRGLDSHLSYRIGLKTFTSADSRAVLGVADAYELPSIPGVGYLKTGEEAMVRFTASYVSGPHQSTVHHQRARSGSRYIRPVSFVSDPVDILVEDVVDLSPDLVIPHQGGSKSVTEIFVDRLRGQGLPPHEVWLPPLAESPTLDQLLPPLATDPQRGLCVLDGAWYGTLQVPIGLIDLPYEHRRDPLVLDFSGSGGHAVVVGGPQSGKSTTIRTMISALALTLSPQEFQAYVIDLGGGSLAGLAGLPHVGVVANRRDPDRIRRTVAEMLGVLSYRESIFRDLGVESMSAYRTMRAQGRIPEGYEDPFGDVFLMIDGWMALRQEFEDLEGKVTQLAQQGLSFGIHVVITASRWAEVRPALKDTLGSRVELRLGDPSESEFDRKIADHVPADRAGRGLTPAAKHSLVALPRIDGVNDPASLGTGAANFVQAVSSAWTGSPAPQVRMLPDYLSLADVPFSETKPRLVPLGLDEDALAPVYLDFDADPHFVYLADGEAGKTTALRTIIQGIMASRSSAEARFLVVDYRRTLLGFVPEEYLAGYSTSENILQQHMAAFTTKLREREPHEGVTAEQLRSRSWWTGPEFFVIIDDFDLVATGMNPLALLERFLPLAKDVGLHVIVTRRTGGAWGDLNRGLINHIKNLAQPGFVGTGSPEDGELLAKVKARSSDGPGRGTLVTRRGNMRIHVAHPVES